MDASKIHIRTPLGEVLVRRDELDPAKWRRFPHLGMRGYTLWAHPQSGASIVLLEFDAGGGNPDRHTHASNQFMYCLEGEYEYLSSGLVLRPGDFVELVAERDVIAVVSNCAQIYNPCNGFNPTPVRIVVSKE